MSNPCKVYTFFGEPGLEKLQEAVGGYIEEVRCPDGRLMYVNEDGRMKQLPVNEMASDIAGRMILGDVAFVKDLKGGNDEPSN
jgi:hypothetical protein